MEEKQFNLLMNEIKGLTSKVTSIEENNKKTEEKLYALDENFAVLNEKIDKNFIILDEKIDENFTTLDGKIDNTRFELTKEIFTLGQNLERQINDFKEINSREHAEMGDYFQRLYQESKNDRKSIHQDLETLSAAHKLNRMDIDKLMARC